MMEKKRKVLPLVWLLIALVGMALAHRYLPLAQYLDTPWNRAGIGPLCLGIYVAAVSAGSFRKAGTGLVPFDEATALVTGGFFRYTRNPMYLGMVLLLLGVSMLLGSLGSVMPVPLFAWVIRRNFILGEERFMEKAFGEEYLAYKRRVRRWI
jgi:protein-S-isoprenylcysteine O-methyltransferase Ste14